MYWPCLCATSSPAADGIPAPGIFRPVYLLALGGNSKWVTEPYVTTPEPESQHAGDVTTHISFVAHNADEAATATAKVTLYKGGEIVTSAPAIRGAGAG